MSVLTINAFPSTATITATYNEEIITGIGQVVIEANDSTVVNYTVEAQQCTSKSGTFTISGDMTEAVALNYIGSVSVDTWVPSTGRDTFPTHIAMLGKGGWRSVESNDERDAIPSARREAGMSVYVASEKKLYILNSDLITWSLFSAGGVIEMPTPSEPELGNIVQYIGETTEDYIQGYFYKCISDGAEPATYSWEQIDVQPATDLIWGNIEGDITNQEDLNTELTSLQDQIDSLSGRGRYLTLWNCSTGLAETNPPESPYTYKTGDYFIVGTVAASGGTNYRPDGTSYTTGVASTTVETEEVSADDTYIFDGSTWHLQYNSQKTVTFTNIAGSPYDNTNLANALNSKVSRVENTPNIVYGTDENGDETTYDMTAFGQIDNVAVHGVDQTITDKRVDLSVVEQLGSLPLASEDLVGRVVQYTGGDTQDLVHNYFYECKPIYTDETRVVKSASSQLTASADLDTFAQSGLEYNTQYLYEKHGAHWDCIDPEGITITGPRAGLVLSGVINTNDQVILEVDREFVWEQVNVQPQTDLVWGNITGTLSDQTDLQGALDSKQDVLTPGTNITIEEDAQTGDLVISSTTQESFYRGRFNSWNSVPINESGYLPEPGTQDLKTPTNNDFIVIIDPSDYASPEFTENFTFTGFQDPELGYGVSWTYLNVTYKVYGDTVTFGPGDCLRLMVQQGGLTALRTTIVDGTPLYPSSGVRWLSGGTHSASTTGSPGDYTGTWRFYYNGDWATDGKLGWLPQYQIEEVLPIATDTQLGVVKVDNSTIVVDAEGTISATAIESFYRGRFNNWSSVPTNPNSYVTDYHGDKTPTENDYMVISDTSDYYGDFNDITSNCGNGYLNTNTGEILSPESNTWQTSRFIEVLPGQEIVYSWTRSYAAAAGEGMTCFYDSQKQFISGRAGPGTSAAGDYSNTFTSPNDAAFIRVSWLNSDTNIVLRYSGSSALDGTWRFVYHGKWDEGNKANWKPEYQIEDVLPIADGQTLGIAKLYTTTGQNTDGSVTQKLVTDELGKKQDTLTAGTGIDISTDASTGNLVISSTSSESFYRGTFATWTLVPTNPTNYVEDPVHHLKTPTNTDYMIVTDASDYYKPGAEITIQLKGYVGGTGYVLELSGEWSDTLIAYNTPYERVYGNNELIINFDAHDGQWSWRVRFNIPVILNGTRYDAYDVWTGGSASTTRVFNEIVDQPCEGTWRFGYYGEWDTAGRNGWVAEYKIEDTLPIASDTVAGITKLYTTTGSNTDGTMDQSSITIELGNKQDLLTNASNAGEGIIIDDVTQEISTNNIVWRKW